MEQTPVIDLLERPLYSVAQVDRLLGLKSGTSRRWIDGYRRQGKIYEPVVRVESTGSDVVTWGEFVETRLLSEYRDAGVSLVRMRPAIERLRESFHPKYPLAYAKPYANGKELVLAAQESVGLESSLQLVVIRNGQIVLTEPAANFYRSAEFRASDGVAERIKPRTDIPLVSIDPLRQFGEPVVRSVPTEVIAEQIRAGESVDAISSLFDLDRPLVEAALRYELHRGLTANAA